MFRCNYLFALVLMMATGSHALAQWSTSPTVNTAISSATGNQEFPVAVSDGAGGVIMTWIDYRNASDYDIYAQKISVDGTVAWTANGVAIGTGTGNQMNPVIIADNSGGAIIAWDDTRSGNNKIYVQRINSIGVVQWTSNGVAITAASGVQTTPAIVSDGGGGVIISWTDSRNLGTSNDIYSQRFNSSGVAQWTTDGVLVCSASGSQTQSRITTDNSGGAIIAWQDQRTDNNDIYAQRVNSVGTTQWTTNGVAICTSSNSQYIQDIISDGAGGAIISWHDFRNGTDLDYYAQRINSAGTVQWTANGTAICTASSPVEFSDMATDNAGGAFFVWEDRRDGTCCNADIYAQHINNSGTALWNSNGLAICTINGSQGKPAIASDGGTGAFITWHDYRGTTDIYAQHIESNGNILWTENGTAVCSAAGNQYYPDVIEAGVAGGRAIFVWQDMRDGSQYDIYAQNIFCNSAPATPDAVSGTSSICSGSTNSYSISEVPDANIYVWTLPVGWAGSSSTSSITATANSTGGNITVAAANLCGVSNTASKSIVVNSTPATPGSISGVSSLCSDAFSTYSIAPVPGATSYNWTLPSDWTGSSSTNSIDAVAGSSSGSNNITVSASNSCGTSATISKTVTVNVAPATPGIISGSAEILVGSTNTYSISAVSGATSYEWTLPSGWNGSSTTNSINATSGTISGNISVTASNVCGTSGSSTKSVTVNKLDQFITFNELTPVTTNDSPFTLTGSATSGLTVSYSSSQLEVATISGNLVTIHSAGSTIITASQTGSDSYKPATEVSRTLVVETVTGVETDPILSRMSVFPNPGEGRFEIKTKDIIAYDDFVVMDVLGKKLNVAVIPTSDPKRFIFDLTNHPRGIYFITIQGVVKVIRLINR